MKKIEIRSIPAKVADTLHPSNVTLGRWYCTNGIEHRIGRRIC